MNLGSHEEDWIVDIVDVEAFLLQLCFLKLISPCQVQLPDQPKSTLLYF